MPSFGPAEPAAAPAPAPAADPARPADPLAGFIANAAPGATAEVAGYGTVRLGRSYTAASGELLVERMVKEFKRHGRAAGAGYYDYPADGTKHLWPGLKTHFEKPFNADPLKAQDDIKQRLLYRQAVETARCLQEGVLTSSHDANIGSIFGIGFPAWTGGALQFVYSEGLDHFIANCAALASKHGEGFALTVEVIQTLRDYQTV
jgi:3-hydroxyacyl-CoA dehydrogenase/enoyl-CoA hydratase/3-hydroxybutyryl-CoA epimerase